MNASFSREQNQILWRRCSQRLKPLSQIRSMDLQFVTIRIKKVKRLSRASIHLPTLRARCF